MPTTYIRHASRPNSLKGLLERQEYIFGGITLLALLLFGSQWDAPVTRHDGLATMLSTSAAVVDSGVLARKIWGVIIGVAGWIWLQRYSTQNIRSLGIRSWLLSAWLIWICSSVLWSDAPSLAFRRLGVFLMLFVSALAMASLRSSHIFALFTAICIASLVSGVACELFWGTFHPFAAGYRFGGAAYPNLQGTILAVGVMSSIGFAITGRRHKRIAIAAGLMCLVALIMTNSRSALAGLITACVFGLVPVIVRMTDSPRRAHVPIAVVCILIALTLTFATVRSSSRILLQTVAERRDESNTESFNGRTDVWAACVQYALKRPILGYGYDSFWTSERISELSTRLGWYINEAHSSYLDDVLNLGLVGAGLFLLAALGVLVFAGSRCIQGSNEHYAWALFLLFMFVHGITEAIMMPIISLPAYAIIVAICRLSYFDYTVCTVSSPLRRGYAYEKA